MKQKVLYVAALMLLSSSFGMAKKKGEDGEGFPSQDWL